MCIGISINLVWHLELRGIERERERETYCNNFLLRSERSAEVGAGALFIKICARLSKVLLFYFKIRKFLLSLPHSFCWVRVFAWIEMGRNFFFACSLLHSNLHYPQYLALSARKPCASHFFSSWSLFSFALSWMKKLDFLNKRVIKKIWWWWRYADYSFRTRI